MRIASKPPRRIGALRHRVTLEELARTDDGGGGGTIDWLPVADLWSAIRPLSGDEPVIAEAISGTVSHLVVVRHRPGISPSMRFRFGTRRLAIVAVLDADERRCWLDCYCVEKDL